MATRREIKIRETTRNDAPQIQNIFNYYVTTSVITFQIVPVGTDYIANKLEETYKVGLPFLVATIPQHDDNLDISNSESSRGTERVVGYSYASPFRNYSGGYKHTVEITLILHPDYRSQGIGSRLLATLLEKLRSVGVGGQPILPPVKEVTACMAIDTESQDGKHGEGLREWYEKRGFREVGRMQDVGRKFERWIGVIFLQLSLRNREEIRGLDFMAANKT